LGTTSKNTILKAIHNNQWKNQQQQIVGNYK
jgi:hypothetical protein